MNTINGASLNSGEPTVGLSYPSELSWCCCHAAMEPSKGTAAVLKPNNSALFRE